MKKIAFVALLALFFSGCDWFAKNEKKEESKPKFVIANVLDKELYDDCHIKGSIQVDFMGLKDYAGKHWDKETTEIVLHCSNYKCTASGAGAKALKEMGFKKVYAYEAGIAEAKREGIAVEGPCREKYLQDYVKPEGFEKLHKDVEYGIISTEELKKKIEEFALNK